jgi:hypothetical protein
MPDPTPLWIRNPGMERLVSNVREHLFDPQRPTRHLPRMVLAAVGGVALMTAGILATVGAPASVALLPLGMALDGLLTVAPFAAVYFGFRGVRALARRLRGGPRQGPDVGVDGPGLEGLNWFGDPLLVELSRTRQIQPGLGEPASPWPARPTLDQVPTYQTAPPREQGL